MVSNEVGLGVHPDARASAAATATCSAGSIQVGGAAGTSLLLVAGRAIPLTDPWELL